MLPENFPVSILKVWPAPNGCIDGPGTMAEPGLVSVLLKKYAGEAELKKVYDDNAAVAAVRKVDMEVHQ